MAKIDPISNLLSNSDLIYLSEQFDKIQKEDPDIGFNVFTLTSDFYYRENFHSDIIATFLDPIAKHNEGNRFLDAFIDMLNLKIRKTNADGLIRKDYYVNALVEREKDKIDILISTTLIEKPHCIIIENKINNAPDMQNQIPRYYEVVRHRGFQVDAIVYLLLDIRKAVDKNSWQLANVDEQNTFNEILINIPAYDSSSHEINLVSHWIEPSIGVTNNIDCISLLRQYAELIKSLTPQMEKNSTMEELYKIITKDANLTEQAKRFINMMKCLPEIIATNLVRYFKSVPSCTRSFNWKNQNNNCVVEFKINNVYSQIYIYTYLDSENTYEVFIRENYEWITADIRKEFKPQANGSLMRRFSFGQESHVIDTIERIIENKE